MMEASKRPPMNVVVVGGSMAGLMQAIALHSLGHNVHILEKSSPELLQSEAAGLRLGTDAKTFIDLFLPDEKPYAITLGAMTYTDGAGQITSSRPTREPMHLTTWSLIHHMFQRRFLDGKATNLAKFDTQKLVNGVKYEAGKVTVSYSDLKEGTSGVMDADLVIAADGAHSTIRQTILPASSPKYVGYVTWRGAVPESIVSEESKSLFLNRVVVFPTPQGYILSYNVPSDDGSREQGTTQLIWVWYDMLSDSSDEYNDTFTDSNGRRHLTTIPRGQMQEKIWKKRQRLGQAVLNRSFAELLQKTTDPFVSAIRESEYPSGHAFDCKVLLVGDAFCLFRPHVGESTNQAARHALGLYDVLRGRSSWEDWEEESTDYAKGTSAFSAAYGEYSFSGIISAELRDYFKGRSPWHRSQNKSNL